MEKSMTISKKSRHGISLRQKSVSRPDDKLATSHSSSTDDTDLDSQQCDSSSFEKMTGKNNTPGERLQRSRERNRIHARKTRQRKKEQMQNLQKRAEELKQEQIRLKQSINEKATASILVGLFSKDSSLEQVEDPRVEALLRRPIDEIPDASKLPELPALILPGQHNSKKHKSSEAIASKKELPNDGIDYELLGKDRSKCTPAELDQIRRERNRMHAKRTRDRKRLFMEEMADMCSKLEEENKVLQGHLAGISGLKQSDVDDGTPELSSEAPTVTPLHMEESMMSSACMTDSKPKLSDHGVTLDQIKTLLEAAGTFTNTLSTSPASASTSASEGGSLSDHDDSFTSRKRRKLDTSGLPQSITATSPPTAVGV